MELSNYEYPGIAREHDTYPPTDAPGTGNTGGDIPPTDLPPTSLGPEDGDGAISPELADRLFEMTANNTALTPEQEQAAMDTYDLQYWLGGDLDRLRDGQYQPDGVQYQPLLVYMLDDKNLLLGSRLTPEQLNAMVDQQLSRLRPTLAAVADSLTAAQNLVTITQQMANRNVLATKDVTLADQRHPYYLGSYVVRETDAGELAIEPEYDDDVPASTPTHVQYTHPSGEIRIIKNDSSERYRVIPYYDGTISHDGQVYQVDEPTPMRVIAEEILAIPADSPEYFSGLHGLLEQHQAILLEAAESNGNIPHELRRRLENSSAALWRHIGPTHIYNESENRLEKDGLEARGRKIAAYRRAVERRLDI